MLAQELSQLPQTPFAYNCQSDSYPRHAVLDKGALEASYLAGLQLNLG